MHLDIWAGVGHPQNSGNLVFWAAREIWAKPNFREVCMYVCVFFLKFTQDSGCLARDEFPFIFKGDHIVIYKYIFAIVLLLGTILYCSM